MGDLALSCGGTLESGPRDGELKWSVPNLSTWLLAVALKVTLIDTSREWSTQMTITRHLPR